MCTPAAAAQRLPERPLNQKMSPPGTVHARSSLLNRLAPCRPTLASERPTGAMAEFGANTRTPGLARTHQHYLFRSCAPTHTNTRPNMQTHTNMHVHMRAFPKAKRARIEVKPSLLCQLLLKLWPWGLLSPQNVQKLAHNARQDMEHFRKQSGEF